MSEQKLSQQQHVKTLKIALHHMSTALGAINQLKPEELLDLFEDSTEPSSPRDRFQFISTQLLNLGANISDMRMVLVNLGQYNTIENWISNETKEVQKSFLSPEKDRDEEDSEREERV